MFLFKGWVQCGSMNPAKSVTYMAINLKENMSIFLPLSATPIMFVSFYIVILNAHLIYKVLIKGHNVKII